jgi:hypothetical protein
LDEKCTKHWTKNQKIWAELLALPLIESVALGSQVWWFTHIIPALIRCWDLYIDAEIRESRVPVQTGHNETFSKNKKKENVPLERD